MWNLTMVLENVKFDSLLYIHILVLFFTFYSSQQFSGASGSWSHLNQLLQDPSEQWSTFSPLHNNSGAGQRNWLLELDSDWVWRADQDVPLQIASAAALWKDFSRYPCHLPLLDLESRWDQNSFSNPGLSGACCLLPPACNGRSFIWHTPFQNIALMPCWQWGMAMNLQPNQTYFLKPGYWCCQLFEDEI